MFAIIKYIVKNTKLKTSFYVFYFHIFKNKVTFFQINMEIFATVSDYKKVEFENKRPFLNLDIIK